MAFLFGGERRVPADPIREHQSEIRRAIRGMDREDARSAASEKQLLRAITQAAQEQRLPQCKAKARELVRLRAHRARLYGVRTHLTGLSQQLEAVRGTQQVHRVVEQTTALMRGLNARLTPKAGVQLLAEFERQNAALAAGQEVMQETLDSVLEADDEQEASDDALANIFLELGLHEAAGLHRASLAASLDPAADAEMGARLARLRPQSMD